MILILLLLYLVLLVVINYYIFNKELSNPNIIVCSVWVFSLLCALYNYNNWGINYGEKSALIIVVTVTVFLGVGVLVSKLFVKCNSNSSISIIEVNQKLLIILIIISAILCVYNIVTTSKNIMSYGMQNFSENMYAYRIDSEANSSMIVNQITKVVKCAGYIYMYVGINNIVASHMIRKNIKLFVPAVCYAVSSLTLANRTSVMELVFAMLICFYFVIKKSGKNINRRFISRAFIIVFVFFAFFCFIRPYVGRLNEDDPMMYITKYAGGSIQLFDMFVKNPKESMNFGGMTFRALYENMDKIGLVHYVQEGIEFRKSNNVLIGNVYTSLRKPLQDFGLGGLVFLQIIMSFVYQYWYNISKIRFFNKNSPRSFLFFLINVTPLFMHSISETFYSAYVCLNFIVMLIIYRFVYYLIFNYGGKYESTSEHNNSRI